MQLLDHDYNNRKQVYRLILLQQNNINIILLFTVFIWDFDLDPKLLWMLHSNESYIYLISINNNIWTICKYIISCDYYLSILYFFGIDFFFLFTFPFGAWQITNILIKLVPAVIGINYPLYKSLYLYWVYIIIIIYHCNQYHFTIILLLFSFLSTYIITPIIIYDLMSREQCSEFKRASARKL